MPRTNTHAAYPRPHRMSLTDSDSATKEAVFDTLARLGATVAIVLSEGDGDRGYIESIEIWNGDSLLEGMPQTIVTPHRAKPGTGETAPLEMDLYDALAHLSLVGSSLARAHSGYDSGDGYCRVVFDVAKRTIALAVYPEPPMIPYAF